VYVLCILLFTAAEVKIKLNLVLIFAEKCLQQIAS
jgi:hypothetical protein